MLKKVDIYRLRKVEILEVINRKNRRKKRQKGGENKLGKVNIIEKQKRIYKVGLMLRRNSGSFILDYIRQEWGLERAQAYNYIKAARKEWKKYFEKLKGDGISYHIAQLRDLKDQAYSRKVIIGRGDNKETVIIADLGLVLEITKEEAKLMGIYPAGKHEETRKVIILGKKERKDE